MDLPRKRDWTKKDPAPSWGWWKGMVFLECPEGHRARVNTDPQDGGHRISSDGYVTPSVVCPGGAEIGKPLTCTFHERDVRFLDWGPPLLDIEVA